MKTSTNNSIWTRLFNKLRLQSLMRKSIILMLLLGLVPLLFYGIISIISANRTLEHENVMYLNDMMQLKVQYVKHIMADVESLASNLSGIDEINAALAESPETSSYDRLSTQAKIGYILSGYTNLNGLISIDIFSTAGSHYHVGETLDVENINQELLNNLYSETGKSGEHLYWRGVEKSIYNGSKYSHVMLAAQILRKKGQGSNDNPLGLLVISYDPKVFADNINYSAESFHTILVDAKQKIVYHPEGQYIGNTISDEIFKQFSNESGHFNQTIDGSNMLVTYAKIEDTGWSIVSLVPVSSILSKTNTENIIFIALLGFSCILIFVFGVIISKQIVLPIKKVIDTFGALQNGSLEKAERLNLTSKDEIGELGKLFNSFIDARADMTLQKKLERQLNEQNRELQEAMEKLKNTQAQMLQQEKLAGIGQLAAGVAHEINNPLGYVSGNVDMLQLFLDRYERLLTEIDKIRKMCVRDEKVQDALPEQCQNICALWDQSKIDMVRANIPDMMHDVTEGLKRIEAIVNGLRSFSRNNQLEEKSAYDLNEGIRTTLLVANNEIKYNCEVEFAEGKIPLIIANGGQINQVLLNIIINAAHAIKDKYRKDKGNIRIETFCENQNVICRICDDGCGMPESVRKRVFEPFFTTKPVGQGTGLGLGIAYDIICNKHAGTIEAESREGEGTCFTFSLPITVKDKEENI